MSWIDGLLIGLGRGLPEGVQVFQQARARQKEEDAESQRFVAQRMEAVDRMLRERDELQERKRSARKQEELEHERNVQTSLDRMLDRENTRAYREQAGQRAADIALMNAQSREKIAGMPARSRPQAATPKTSNPDGLTQSQRDGLMLINRDWLPGEAQEKAEMETLFRRAREAFPNAHPGDVAMAAKRMYDRMAAERRRAQADKYR